MRAKKAILTKNKKQGEIMKNFIQKLTIMGALVLCVATHANAAPTDGERQAFTKEELIKTYVKKSGVSGCQALTDVAKFFKVSPCPSCSETEEGIQACMATLFTEISNELLPVACQECTRAACQKEEIKKACEIFCCPSYSATIKECTDCPLPSAK